MDYYQRKAKAQALIKKMLESDQNYSDDEICFAVEDAYQLSSNTTKKYLTLKRGL